MVLVWGLIIPVLLSIFFVSYKYKYILKYGTRLNIFHYTHDILVLNYDFTNEYFHIHPNCLTLKKLMTVINM